ncbi:DAD4 (YDR320C-A) [Zygosaccharomyces parabailii]|nr:DAD4 (YDR320C-A) [Zygosaccharomyces parabailii]
MENPYEQVQVNILSRIMGNIERLNQSVSTLNQELANINRKNQNLEIMGQICENYRDSIQFNLDTTGNRKPAL